MGLTSSFEAPLFLGVVLSAVLLSFVKKRLKRMGKRQAAYVLALSFPALLLPALMLGAWLSDSNTPMSFVLSTITVAVAFGVANYASYCAFTEPG